MQFENWVWLNALMWFEQYSGQQGPHALQQPSTESKKYCNQMNDAEPKTSKPVKQIWKKCAVLLQTSRGALTWVMDWRYWPSTFMGFIPRTWAGCSRSQTDFALSILLCSVASFFCSICFMCLWLCIIPVFTAFGCCSTFFCVIHCGTVLQPMHQHARSWEISGELAKFNNVWAAMIHEKQVLMMRKMYFAWFCLHIIVPPYFENNLDV